MISRKGVLLLLFLYLSTTKCAVEIQSVTHVPEPDSKVQITLPICCQTNEEMTEDGCVELNPPREFWPGITIHWHNETHFDTQAFTKDEVKLNFTPMDVVCEPSAVKYPLEPGLPQDKAYLLMNGSLLHLFDQRRVVAIQNYCLAAVNFSDEDTLREIQVTAILCGSESEPPGFTLGFVIYAIGLYISGACLLTIVALFTYKRENMHRDDGKCIVAYCGSFAVTFIILGTAQLAGVSELWCKVVGFLLQLTYTYTFTWLVFYSMETYRSVVCYLQKRKCGFKFSHFDEKLLEYTERFNVKIAITIGYTVLIIIVSVCSSIMPTDLLKTNFGRNLDVCFIPNQKFSVAAKIILFHVPILILIVISIAFDLKGKYLLRNWRVIRQERLLQIKRRACMLVIIIMTICWLMNFVSSLINSTAPVWFAIDIINTLQGVIFMTLIIQVIMKIDTGKGWRSTISFRETIKVPTDCESEANLDARTPETELKLMNGEPKN